MDVLVLQRRSDKRFLTVVDHEGAHWSPSLMDAHFVVNDWLARAEQKMFASILGARVVRVRMEVVGGRA